jgi:hypothetical protein
MPDSYGQSIAIPALTEAPNIAAVGAAIDAVVGRTVLRFASASARAANLAAPVEGMVSWLQDVDRAYVYDGAAWVELARALTTQFVEDTTNRTVTSTGYVNGSSALSTTITGPQSGKIEVVASVRCDNSVGANTLSSFNATGSGTGTIYTASDAPAIQWANTVSAGPFVASAVISCTPGETVTVILQHRVAAASTGNLRYRSLKVRQIWI